MADFHKYHCSGNDYILIEKKLQWTSMMNWTSAYKEQVKTFRNDI